MAGGRVPSVACGVCECNEADLGLADKIDGSVRRTPYGPDRGRLLRADGLILIVKDTSLGGLVLGELFPLRDGPAPLSCPSTKGRLHEPGVFNAPRAAMTLAPTTPAVSSSSLMTTGRLRVASGSERW